MDYFEKLENNPYTDLLWNIPERKQGSVNVIGGNSGGFRAEVKVAEHLQTNYPVEVVNLVLPDALQGKVPPVPGVTFLGSTESGSFAEAEELTHTMNEAEYNLLMGDLSKNTITGKAVGSACAYSEKPLLITRDSVEMVAENEPDKVLLNERIVLFASVAQLMKVLRAVYYPKMLLMSQSLVQVADVLHKFTLSYPVGVVTLHNGQVLVAKGGTVKAVGLEHSELSPIMFWQGELAARTAVMNLYNPNRFIQATICALF